MNKYRIASIIIILSIGTSCRKIIPGRVTDKQDVNYELIRDNYFPNNSSFRSLSIPRLNADLTSPDLEIGLLGNLRMVKDSAIFVSLNAGLGIEIARALVEKEQIHIIDRINSSHEKMNFQQVHYLIGLTFDYRTIENILFNSFPLGDLISSRDVEISNSKDFIIVYDKESHLIGGFSEAKIYFRASDFLVGRIEIVDSEKGHFAYIDYSNFTDTGNGVIIPHGIEIFVNRSGELNKLSLKYQRVDINTVRSINFSVPVSYK